MTFFENVVEVIRLLDDWLPEPEDEVQLEEWVDAALTIIDSFEFSEEEQPHLERLVDRYEEQKRSIIQFQQKARAPPVLQAELDELLNRKQLEQRTPEWYQQMSTILSASELGNLFSSPRQRAKLVLSKTLPPVPRFQPLAVTSERMSAFDWGIRFEPVVKQIYEHRYGVTLKELGRLHHPTDPRCTASPDGLVYHCPKQERTGRLVEIKCPVTREIDGSVPKDYYAQMQMQLHVTGRPVCDYIEAAFSSTYHIMVPKEGPGWYDGIIAVIRRAEMKNGQEFDYVYSPVNPEAGWRPVLKEDEELIELTPWRLHQWSEQMIHRNEEWWKGLQPVLEGFWSDVEKAKQGAFTVPDSTRVKTRAEPCRIQFHRLDENGEPLTIDKNSS